MTELDQFWANEIAQALEKAKAARRGDIADYLALRASNDFLRSIAVKWLMRSFVEAGDEKMFKGREISLDTDANHSFAVGANTMVGTKMCFRWGLRALTVEAGWTRLPEHGVVRGGGLAHARVYHFGMQKAGKELLLLKMNERPVWVIQEDEYLRSPLFEDFFQQHFAIFLDEN